MIALGMLVLVVAFLTKMAMLWTLGVVLVISGSVATLLGAAARPVGGKADWY
ncbi:MAG: hypothetical protein HOQ24_11555 [Mycobacteriaceae bacterium]|nr:hypothetical protein [Mycobacteriaceae bacterium]